MAVGSGALTLPYICKMVGLGLGLVLITCGMLGSFWSLEILIEVSETLKSRSYSAICERTGGRLGLSVYNFAILSQQVGALLAYQIISA
jgi:amino acid permease